MKQIISGQQFKANPSNGVSTVIRLPLDKKRNGKSQRPVINNAYMQLEDLTGKLFLLLSNKSIYFFNRRKIE